MNNENNENNSDNLKSENNFSLEYNMDYGHINLAK